MIAEETKSPSEKRVVIKEQEKRTHGPVKNGFRRGCQPRIGKNPKVKFDRVTRSRLMITFEDHAGFLFLLQDQEELERLKPASYLDSDYLNDEGKYRVHVYYLPHCKTRIEQWKEKYPGVSKKVELDIGQIRVKLDENNTLSKAILSIEKRPKLDHNPPEIPEEGPTTKKVKTGANKTKNELLSENQNLVVQLRATVQQLHVSTRQVATLRGEVKTLLDTQDNLKNLFSSLFGQVVGKLSPNSQEAYRIDFDNCLNTVKNAKTRQYMENSQGLHNTNPEEEQKDPENLNDNGDDFSLKSPKSRVPSEEGRRSAHQENSVKSSETKKSSKERNILFHEEDMAERVEDNVSSSCLHTSDDDVKPVEESCIQKSPIEPQQQLQTIELLPNKKNKKKQAVQKEPWSHMTKGVLIIWQAIKFAIQRGETEEEMRQNKNTPSNWKPILDPEYEHRKLFLAFLSSECSIGFNE